MLEIVLYSLFVGSLGLQAVALGGWMRWQQHLGANQQEEEEILTQYETKEYTIAEPLPNGAAKQLKDPRLVGWEFKIVRAHRNVFRDSQVLQKLCQEEAESGWILLEKLDDRRVRFKRPIALREIIKSEYLKHEPYRSHYGPSWQPWSWAAAIAVLVAMTLPAYLGYALVSRIVSSSQTQPPIPATFPALEPSSKP
ncbi:hypothetical protein [Gloeocapsopsis dulcis]|uniref:Uncharacterized protein n=1 Tax=Gloeocapsopsis dulcis AAB1 = 1H9 TaxID=1433147 RepID=A0A6N8G1C4_9CHRO|nr:hypothetical protein [Gloeocapsopsis dulcis]MUL39133.1 hypothetical protein [Gloeocapsopsis dulcis AAB1 = 1H9]WNN90734.1 hypothetical protein P0S91_06545 [Gloeocapsopsis dulcis]